MKFVVSGTSIIRGKLKMRINEKYSIESDVLNNNFTYDEIAEMLGVAKGTVFNYIRRFKIRKIYE